MGFGDNCNEVVIEEKDKDNLDGNRNECRYVKEKKRTKKMVINAMIMIVVNLYTMIICAVGIFFIN